MAMIKWYPDDEDEPDGDASANATEDISLHVEVVGWERSWRWRVEVADVNGDEPVVLLEGRAESPEDGKATAEAGLRRWIAAQAEALGMTENDGGLNPLDTIETRRT